MDKMESASEEGLAKSGHKILLRDGTWVVIHSTEQGIAFYEAHGHVPLRNLVPAANGYEDCWEVDASLP